VINDLLISGFLIVKLTVAERLIDHKHFVSAVHACIKSLEKRTSDFYFHERVCSAKIAKIIAIQTSFIDLKNI
jgi:hypothetical protein